MTGLTPVEKREREGKEEACCEGNLEHRGEESEKGNGPANNFSLHYRRIYSICKIYLVTCLRTFLWTSYIRQHDYMKFCLGLT